MKQFNYIKGMVGLKCKQSHVKCFNNRCIACEAGEGIKVSSRARNSMYVLANHINHPKHDLSFIFPAVFSMMNENSECMILEDTKINQHSD